MWDTRVVAPTMKSDHSTIKFNIMWKEGAQKVQLNQILFQKRKLFKNDGIGKKEPAREGGVGQITAECLEMKCTGDKLNYHRI